MDNGVMERRASWAGKEHVQTARLFGHLEASPVGSLGGNFPQQLSIFPPELLVAAVRSWSQEMGGAAMESWSRANPGGLHGEQGVAAALRPADLHLRRIIGYSSRASV